MRPTISNDPTLVKSGALTTSYVASSALQCKGWNTALVLLDADLDVAGGATGLQVYIEVANPQGDGAPAAGDWYGLVGLDEAATTATGFVSYPAGIQVYDFGAADGRYAIALNRLVAKFLRVQVKTAGAAGTSTCAVRIVQALT